MRRMPHSLKGAVIRIKGDNGLRKAPAWRLAPRRCSTEVLLLCPPLGCPETSLLRARGERQTDTRVFTQ